MGILNLFKGGKAKDNRAIFEKLIRRNKVQEIKEIISEGFDLNEKIPVEDHGDILPLTCALIYKKPEVARLLIEKGAELNNEEEPAIIYSGIYGDKKIISYIVENGAHINTVDLIRGSALSCALAEENFEAVQALIDNGIDIALHGGSALRDAAAEGYIDIVKLLINKGADINYNKVEGVYLTKTTPLQAAVMGEKEDIVQLLIKKGADVTGMDEYIEELGGQKPKEEFLEEIYEDIEQENKEEVRDYQWHVNKLKSYSLPEEIIEYLGESNKKMDLSGKSECTEYIVFCTVDQVRVFSWKKIMFIDLISEIEGYDEVGILAWLPQYNCFGTLDIENDKFGKIEGVTWQEFLENSGRYIDGSIKWEYCIEINED